MPTLLLTIPVLGVLKFLFIIALIIAFVVVLRWLLGLAGWNPPNSVWAAIGAVLVLLVLLLIASGGTGIVFS